MIDYETREPVEKNYPASKYEGIPDETLALAFKNDPNSFEELYRRYAPRIYGYHLAQSRNVPDAEDLTSKTFYQSLSHIPKFEPRSTFKSWLFTIAHNLAVNYYRDRSRHPTLSADECHHLPDKRNHFDDVIKREEADLVRQMVAELPRRRQEVVSLKFVAELPNKEIAQILGMTEGAVKALLHRTIEDLRLSYSHLTSGKLNTAKKTPRERGVF